MPTPETPLARPLTFWALLRAQLLIAAITYGLAVFSFVSYARGQDAKFTELATGPHLGTLIRTQVQVVPAYLLVALVYALLLFPLLARRPLVPSKRLWRRVRRFAGLVGLDLGVYLLSLGPFFHTNPGLLDGTARKLAPVAPGLDLYVLYRWHLLDAASLLFALLCGWAALFYVRRLASSLRQHSRLARGLVVAVLLTASAWALTRFRGARDLTPTDAGQARPPPPPNLLIIASDSLRFDHLGVHGYHRTDISPHIDAFARQSLDLTNLHVATASTLESWMSFMTGQFPPTHGVRYMYPRKEQAQAAGEHPGLLPKLLNDAGHHTVVSSNWAGNCFKLIDMGFTQNMASDVQNFDAMLMEGAIWAHMIFPLYFSNEIGELMLPEIRRITGYLRPDVLSDRMFGAIDDATGRQQPFFGLLFYSTTHLPYTASHPYNLKYTDPDYDGPNRYQIDVRVHELITTGFAPTLPPGAIEHIRDLYDGTVSEFDAYVGEALAELEARGLADRTIVIVTTDHGEDLYDAGSTLGHGTNFFGGDQSTRIPFFIRIPGAVAPPSLLPPATAVGALTRNVDLAPTLLELLGVPPPGTGLEGVSLLPLFTGAVADLNLVAFAETCYLFFPKSKAMNILTEAEKQQVYEVPGAVETLDVDPDFNNNLVLRADLHDAVIRAKDRMVRTRRWKLVDIPGRDASIKRLFDVVADPSQSRDVAAAHPDVLERLTRALFEYDTGRGAQVRWPPDAEKSRDR